MDVIPKVEIDQRHLWDGRDDGYLYTGDRVVLTNNSPLRLRNYKPNPDGNVKLDPVLLRDVMTAPFEEFAKINGAKLFTVDGRRHIYIDRGSSILGVAHLDTVVQPYHFWCNSEFICCPTIDNRLGAWAVIYGVPSMGYSPDILLTEGEEKHASTARDFKATKTYNWMFSFDRQGTDAALYGFKDSQWVAELRKFKIEGQYGAYSDIADLEDLGCKGVNVGCGMYNYHSEKAHAKVDQLMLQLERFRKFCEANWNVHFPHKKATAVTRTRYNGYEDYDGGDFRNWTGSFATASEHDMERDKKKVREQFEFFVSNLVEPEDWWLIAGEKGYSVDRPSRCSCCGRNFRNSDTHYSLVKMKSLCRYCLTLEALPMRVFTIEEYLDNLIHLRREIKLAELELETDNEKQGDSL